MAIDFDIENLDYKKALEDIRHIKLSKEHINGVFELIEEERIKTDKSAKLLQVDDELLHRRFTL